jgi:hypothetical protein
MIGAGEVFTERQNVVQYMRLDEARSAGCYAAMLSNSAGPLLLGEHHTGQSRCSRITGMSRSAWWSGS